MVRKVLGFTMFTALLAAAGCGGGYSDEKAKIRCDQEQIAKSQCMTDEAYQACLTCYQECGDQCDPQATCAETYECR